MLKNGQKYTYPYFQTMLCAKTITTYLLIIFSVILRTVTAQQANHSFTHLDPPCFGTVGSKLSKTPYFHGHTLYLHITVWCISFSVIHNWLHNTTVPRHYLANREQTKKLDTYQKDFHLTLAIFQEKRTVKGKHGKDKTPDLVHFSAVILEMQWQPKTNITELH